MKQMLLDEYETYVVWNVYRKTLDLTTCRNVHSVNLRHVVTSN